MIVLIALRLIAIGLIWVVSILIGIILLRILINHFLSRRAQGRSYDVVMHWLGDEKRQWLMEETDGTMLQEFWNCQKVQDRFPNLDKNRDKVYTITIREKAL